MSWLLLAMIALPSPAALARLERSYWVHASLGARLQRGYWGPDFPADSPATDAEIARAATLLKDTYGATRLYLILHREIADAEARGSLLAWRAALGKRAELVPTLVLSMYDAPATPVWSAEAMTALVDWLQAELRPPAIAVYDVYPNRPPPPAWEALRAAARVPLVRVGLQPGEAPREGIAVAVQDTWSGLCAGREHADWRAPGFGAEMLGGWLAERNAGRLPVAWDLVAVGWDYRSTARGEYPGYDDGKLNQPLPAGRNRLAARRMIAEARSEVFRGFSSDLFILQQNSAVQDGPEASLHAALRAGRRYDGAFAAPLDEIAAIYRELAAGVAP